MGRRIRTSSTALLRPHMQAIVYRNKGPASQVLELSELPDPNPGPGEVRVRVHYSGVNPSDTKSRAGVSSTAMEYPIIVPHSDGSGVIDRVGSGVRRARIGKRVWIYNAQWQRAHGTAAEFVCLPSAQAVDLLDSASLSAGASFGIPLMTAAHAVSSAGPLAAKRVLVTGAAGNVGQYALQLAVNQGAFVAATVGSASDIKMAQAAGAGVVANYREDWVGVCDAFTRGKGFDLIIEVDAAANAHAYGRLLAFGGRVVVYGSSQPSIPAEYRPMMSKFGTLSFFIVYRLLPQHRRTALMRMSTALRQGFLSHPAVHEHAMEHAATAHEHVERRAGGKAVLCMA